LSLPDSSRQRVDVDNERIIHAVEFDGLADRRIDDARVAQDRGRVIADSIEPVEDPEIDGAGPCRAVVLVEAGRPIGEGRGPRKETRPD